MPQGSPVQFVGLGINRFRLMLGFLWRMEAKLKGVEFLGSSRFQGRPIISIAPGSRMTFGDNFGLDNAVRSNPLGCFQPCVLRTLAAGAELIAEENVGLSGAVVCAGKSVLIGQGTIVGSGAMILDNDFHALDFETGWRNEYVENARPVRIGKFVFVGARAIILKGVTIGDRAVIGAGAVVTRDVPEGQIAAGNPAKIFAKEAAKP